jgi:hypothetical protein
MENSSARIKRVTPSPDNKFLSESDGPPKRLAKRIAAFLVDARNCSMVCRRFAVALSYISWRNGASRTLADRQCFDEIGPKKNLRSLESVSWPRD